MIYFDLELICSEIANTQQLHLATATAHALNAERYTLTYIHKVTQTLCKSVKRSYFTLICIITCIVVVFVTFWYVDDYDNDDDDNNDDYGYLMGP